jgi:hypothetical protein
MPKLPQQRAVARFLHRALAGVALAARRSRGFRFAVKIDMQKALHRREQLSLRQERGGFRQHNAFDLAPKQRLETDAGPSLKQQRRQEQTAELIVALPQFAFAIRAQ